MARRSPTMPGHALPAGGRSSGSRPKKKFKVKKSPARKKAEADVKKAESNREAAKQFVNKDSQKMSRTPKKQAKEFVVESRGRRSKASNKEMKARVAASIKRAPKPHDAVKLSKEQGSKFIQESNKRVVQARKKLAKTPKQGGAYRTGSNRNRYLMDPNNSQH